MELMLSHQYITFLDTYYTFNGIITHLCDFNTSTLTIDVVKLENMSMSFVAHTCNHTS